MDKKIKVLEEVYFCNDKKTAEKQNKPYSASYSYLKIWIDYEKCEVVTFVKSNWNSSYDKEIRTRF